jgi:hypothetical protein
MSDTIAPKVTFAINPPPRIVDFFVVLTETFGIICQNNKTLSIVDCLTIGDWRLLIGD